LSPHLLQVDTYLSENSGGEKHACLTSGIYLSDLFLSIKPTSQSFLFQ